MPSPDPTWFDWISNVAVPVALGFASVLVSITALRVAKASNRLAKDAHESQAAADARAERSRISQLIFDWSSRRWLERPPETTADDAALNAAKSVFSVELTQSTQPGTDALQEILWDMDTRVPKDLGPTGYSYFSGHMASTVDRLVARWIRSPENEADLREIARSAREVAMERAIEHDAELRRAVSSALAKSKGEATADSDPVT
ncbi:hypothetical protein ABY45_14625 [Microbacterium maritypicum]|uniref:hypothetical protein n=1 Tax=Microbacterium maritypicum TaxID=33918 RepID=UPI003D6F0AD4